MPYQAIFSFLVRVWNPWLSDAGWFCVSLHTRLQLDFICCLNISPPPISATGYRILPLNQHVATPRRHNAPTLCEKACTSTLSSVSRLLDLEHPACSHPCQPDLQVSERLLLLVTLYYLPFLPFFFNSFPLFATFLSFHLNICYSNRYSALKLPEELLFLLRVYYPFSVFFSFLLPPSNLSPYRPLLRFFHLTLYNSFFLSTWLRRV